LGPSLFDVPFEVVMYNIIVHLDLLSVISFVSTCSYLRELDLNPKLWRVLRAKYPYCAEDLPDGLPPASQALWLKDALIAKVTNITGSFYTNLRANDRRCNRGNEYWMVLAQQEKRPNGIIAFANAFHDDYGGTDITFYWGTFDIKKKCKRRMNNGIFIPSEVAVRFVLKWDQEQLYEDRGRPDHAFQGADCRLCFSPEKGTAAVQLIFGTQDPYMLAMKKELVTEEKRQKALKMLQENQQLSFKTYMYITREI